jgi:hypothetical protein
MTDEVGFTGALDSDEHMGTVVGSQRANHNIDVGHGGGAPPLSNDFNPGLSRSGAV